MLKGQRLVRIDIPPDALQGKRLCAPTTLDAGANPVFVPYNDSEGYGRTLNLRAIRRDLKELVVEKIPFTEDFVVMKIGKVGANVPSIDWDAVEMLTV